ncbi:class I SAM-dependent methyltransferase [Glacieibacterium sp.]|uniref:class I SAM-dependent methyltransferase n=1 Tax=Glacieibacterium sp. TaxID=2860237 RepID=UPI003AFFE386
MLTKTQISCRLCDNISLHEFTLTVLQKYEIGYFLCTSCGSLQTELPFWLDEAYSSNLNDLDTGAAHRNMDSLAASLTIANLLKHSNIVDIGGGDGLLCRLLRDHNKNAFVSDSYAQPVYAQGFAEPNFSKPDMLTAFEVFEHFAKPDEEIDRLFLKRPSAILIMTTPYSGQGPDWSYLIPNTGHHIFFYSEQALEFIAKKYDFDLFRYNNYSLFCKRGTLTSLMRLILRVRLHPRVIRMYRAILGYRIADGYVQDAKLITDAKLI